MRSSSVAALVWIATAILLQSSGALAQNVGVTGAVNPTTTGQPPGQTIKPIGVSDQVVFNERIVTQAQGQAEILFLDRSSLTVGPNSDLVIDEFVYSPDTGTGRLAASAAKGLFRFVGGALSKNEGAVSIKTPAAIVGIRGGIGILSLGANGTTTVIFLYGEGVSVSSGEQSVRLHKRGWMTTFPGGETKPVDPALLRALVTQFGGQTGATGGASPPPKETDVAGGPGVDIDLDTDIDDGKSDLRNFLRPVDDFDIPQIQKLFRGRQPIVFVCRDCG